MHNLQYRISRPALNASYHPHVSGLPTTPYLHNALFTKTAMLEYQRFLFFPQKRTVKPEYERTYEQLKAGFGWKYYKFLWDRRDRVQMELESHIYSERCSCLYTNPDSESNTPIPPATDHPSSCLLQPRPPQGTYLHNPSLSANNLIDQIPNTF